MVVDLALEYFLFILGASIGVIQMASAYSSLRGLLLTKSKVLSFIVGFSMTVAAFAWFFGSESRNIADNAGGLDGNQSAGLFALGMLSAIITTLILSSIINRSIVKLRFRPGFGLDALKNTTYADAICDTLKRLLRLY